MQEEPIKVGEIVDGKYQVEKVLGRGMMGVVVKAREIVVGYPVAIKFLLEGAGASEEHKARFRREARLCAKLKTQHAIRVNDTSALKNGALYTVMEYLEGEDLAALVERRGALPVAEAVGHVLQACEAVAEAHVSGIVHRDLKPANLFLTRGVGGTPEIKVLDFGVSKLIDDARLTKTGSSLGSPLYMSPEQMNDSSTVDARSDVWALGVILYELIAGVPPFNAATAVQLMGMVSHHPPAPLAGYRADAPAGLCAVIEQAPAEEIARGASRAAPRLARARSRPYRRPPPWRGTWRAWPACRASTSCRPRPTDLAARPAGGCTALRTAASRGPPRRRRGAERRKHHGGPAVTQPLS